MATWIAKVIRKREPLIEGTVNVEAKNIKKAYKKARKAIGKSFEIYSIKKLPEANNGLCPRI